MNLEFDVWDEIIIINADEKFNGKKAIIKEIRIYITDKTYIMYKVWIEDFGGIWLEENQVRKVRLTDDECFMIGKNKGVIK